jgi:hypothetical protein
MKYFLYLWQMKELLFKYFDTFCYGELIVSEQPHYYKPYDVNQAFGYSTNTQYLHYNDNLMNTVVSMFGVTKGKFKKYLGEWFKGRYNLPVSYIV